jgi:hypothetical protein
MWNAAGIMIGERENVVLHRQILRLLPEVLRSEKAI